MGKKDVAIVWMNKPEDHDYAAAQSYLCLIFDEPAARNYVQQLTAAPLSQFKAKDIFRASGLSLLGVSNSHVQKDLDKITAKEALSPLLLVRDVHSRNLIIADGYHRLCAIYTIEEDAVIACKIV